MKTNDELIREFLTGNKIPAEETVMAEYLSRQAETVFNTVMHLASGGKTASLPVKLCICDTYDTFSYMVPVESKGGKEEYYLVHDRHMNTLNTLINAIFLSECEFSRDMERLAYTLCLEERIAAKDKLLAEYYAEKIRRLGGYNCEDELNSVTNRFYTLVQMTYIVAHEAGHFIFSPAGKELQLAYGDITSEMENKVRTLLESIDASLENETDPAVIEDLLNEKRTLSSDNFIEECAADVVGVIIAYTFADNLYVKNEEYRQFGGADLCYTIMTAVLIAMLNIEVVSVLRKGEGFNSFYKPVLTRFTLLAASLAIIWNFQLTQNDVTVKTINRYEQRILTPFSKYIGRISSEIARIASLVKEKAAENAEEPCDENK